MNTTTPQNVQSFILDVLPQIVTEWRLEYMTDEERQKFLDDVGFILYQAILSRSLDILSDKEQEELDRILDQDTTTPVEAFAYLEEVIPTFTQMMGEEVNKLKNEIFID